MKSFASAAIALVVFAQVASAVSVAEQHEAMELLQRANNGETVEQEICKHVTKCMTGGADLLQMKNGEQGCALLSNCIATEQEDGLDISTTTAGCQMVTDCLQTEHAAKEEFAEVVERVEDDASMIQTPVRRQGLCGVVDHCIDIDTDEKDKILPKADVSILETKRASPKCERVYECLEVVKRQVTEEKEEVQRKIGEAESVIQVREGMWQKCGAIVSCLTDKDDVHPHDPESDKDFREAKQE